MPEYSEIDSISGTQASPDGKMVAFTFHTTNDEAIKLRCSSRGLEIMIASLTALLQEAIGLAHSSGETEKLLETIPIEQVGCGPAANSSGVLLCPVLPSGSMLNFALSPQTASQLAEQLSDFASRQLSKA